MRVCASSEQNRWSAVRRTSEQAVQKSERSCNKQRIFLNQTKGRDKMITSSCSEHRRRPDMVCSTSLQTTVWHCNHF